MTAIWINEKTGAARVAADRKTAESFGNSGVVFESEDALAADGRIPSKVLIDIYNQRNADKTVAKFADRKTAARRVFATLLANETVAAPAPATPQPEAPAVSPAKPAGKKAAPTNGRRGAKGNRASKIFPVIIDGKPAYRSGKSATTWKMIVDNPGKTFAEYLAMGARANTINHAIRNGNVKTEG